MLAFCLVRLRAARRVRRAVVGVARSDRGRLADADSLAAGIQEVLADQDLARSLAAAGLARVKRDFGVGPVMQQYLHLYQRLIEHGRP